MLSSILSSVLKFDQSTLAWSQVGVLQQARTGHAMSVVNMEDVQDYCHWVIRFMVLRCMIIEIKHKICPDQIIPPFPSCYHHCAFLCARPGPVTLNSWHRAMQRSLLIGQHRISGNISLLPIGPHRPETLTDRRKTLLMKHILIRAELVDDELIRNKTSYHVSEQWNILID